MAVPPMTVTVVEHDAERLTLDVEHGDAQSWSRAVDPRAMREARRLARYPLALVDVDYGHDHPAERRCTSRFYFVRREA